jgi:hypothetical protein
MRLSSGFLVLSIWNLSYMMGTIYMQIVPSILAFLVFNELKGLKRSESKDRQSNIRTVEWMLFLFTTCVFLPKGAFRREILENSGFSAEKNPFLFGVLFD